MLIKLLIPLTAFIHLLLPALFILWIWRAREQSRLQWITQVILSGLFLLLMWRAGAGWSWFGHYWPEIFLAAYAVMVLRGLPKLKGRPWLPEKKLKPWLSLVTQFAAIILFVQACFA